MSFGIKKLANPYSAFSVSWLLCLLLYSLGWANIFPPLSTRLFWLLMLFIILFGLTGLFFSKVKFSQVKSLQNFNFNKLLIVNVLLYSLNFAYSGIPLLKGTRADEFGIPTIIVLATTLNGFTIVYSYYNFLISHKKKYLLFIIICLALFALAFSRGNIMLSLVTMFFLWINVNLPALNFKKAIAIISGVLLLTYLFGVAGNFRTINEIAGKDNSFDKSYNSNVILQLGGASDSFKESYIPDEFFWTYLYITSPLSNLQYNISKNHPSFSVAGAINIVIDELLFDTVSKRIDELLNRKREDPDLLVEQLTVPTTLANSYNYGGWWGIMVFITGFWCFPFVYALLVLKNPLGVIGISILCTAYFFSIFDNMFILTGLTFQILYPLLFNFINKIKLRLVF